MERVVPAVRHGERPIVEKNGAEHGLIGAEGLDVDGL